MTPNVADVWPVSIAAVLGGGGGVNCNFLTFLIDHQTIVNYTLRSIQKRRTTPAPCASLRPTLLAPSGDTPKHTTRFQRVDYPDIET